jgi:hypothetical protein
VVLGDGTSASKDEVDDQTGMIQWVRGQWPVSLGEICMEDTGIVHVRVGIEINDRQATNDFCGDR